MNLLYFYTDTMNKFSTILLCFLFSGGVFNVFTQDSVSTYQLQKDIFNDLETSRLTHIRKLIDSVGIAAPIPNEVLAKHVALVSSYNPCIVNPIMWCMSS